MKKLICLAGALALFSGSGCRNWCEHHYGGHTAAAPCVPCAPVQQCCPTPTAAPCCPPPAAVPAGGWQRQPQ